MNKKPACIITKQNEDYLTRKQKIYPQSCKLEILELSSKSNSSQICEKAQQKNINKRTLQD